ncbi:hypothetical protein Hanom_Chr08g00730021 [Helianthus anomalus]
MVRFGYRGRVRDSDYRVIHALLYGTPTLSWRRIIMMNTWITRESFHQRMIPYVRLISAMILQQNCLPQESLWVSKPQGDAEDVEMVDEEDETEPPGPRGPKQRYMRPHRELNADVASFVNFRRVPLYRDFNRGQQAVFDNVKNWEETHQAKLQSQCDLDVAHQERMEKYMEEQQMHQALERSQMEHLLQHQQQEEVARRRVWEENEERQRNEQNTLEGCRWSALYVSNELAINNAKVLHDLERHRRDYEAGLPYEEHVGWTDYANLPVPRCPPDPSPHWPEAVGSSFIPPQFQPPAQGEPAPLDNYQEMFEALNGYSYHPNPPVDLNERYQR